MESSSRPRRPWMAVLLALVCNGLGHAYAGAIGTAAAIAALGLAVGAAMLASLVARGVPIERGAVVVHEAPVGAPTRDPLVKRVVAIGGDTVEVRDGLLVLDGRAAERRRLDGPCTYARRAEDGRWIEYRCVEYVEQLDRRAYHTYCTPYVPCGDVDPRKVPPGHVLVLGDHRDRSADSRVYGPIAESAILGRAAYVYFSFGPTGVRRERVGEPLR